MKSRRDEPGPRASGTLAEPISVEVELDLYEELVCFSALSPDQQKEELERVALQTASPIPPAEKPPACFDPLEQSDLPARDSESTPPAESAFSFVDEPLSDPLDQPLGDAPADAAFSFVQESLEPSPVSETRRVTANLPDGLSNTSPLEVIGSMPLPPAGHDKEGGALESPELDLRCEGCGSRSNPEDLFCLSCGQLLAEMD